MTDIATTNEKYRNRCDTSDFQQTTNCITTGSTTSSSTIRIRGIPNQQKLNKIQDTTMAYYGGGNSGGGYGGGAYGGGGGFSGGAPR